MVAKIGCESHYTHYEKDGTVLTGKITSGDIGVAQISRPHHQRTADKLNLDLTDIYGNLAYARYLYDQQGDAPWLAPVDCSFVASLR